LTPMSSIGAQLVSAQIGLATLFCLQNKKYPGGEKNDVPYVE